MKSTWVSQKLWNILTQASLKCVYHVIQAVQAMEGIRSGW